MRLSGHRRADGGGPRPGGHVLSLPLRLPHIGAVEQIFGAVEQVRRAGRNDKEVTNRVTHMSNILKPIDLTERAIRRAIFAMLDGF